MPLTGTGLKLLRKWRTGTSTSGGQRKNARRRNKCPSFESLETRSLLSASAATSIVMQPELMRDQMMRQSAGASNSPTGLTPQQVSQAYAFNQIAFTSGSSQVTGTGAGETIAIVDAYDDPNIQQDLTTFDQKFGLAAPPSFTEQFPGGTRPQGNSGWSEEISLDVEWAHAMAPQANIVLVEAQSASLGALLSAVNVARDLPNVSVISMSWGSSEFRSETSYDSYFTTPTGHIGISFVASSGDSGAGGIWPALSPNVLAVGGTTLNLSSNGSYGSETGWSDSGGGVSHYEAEPTYQESVQSYGARSSPDVAYDANPSTGFSVYDSYSGDDWFTVGGTSAGAPQWSALIAIADQARGSAGTLANAQSALYNLPSTDFHDITSGSNGYQAGPGYDLVTGLGSPIANLIVDGLAGVSTPPSQGLTAPSLAVSAVSSTVAQLSWNAVSGAQGYNVYQVVNGQNDLLESVSSTTTSVQITGLTPGATESFMVQAFNNNDSPPTANSSVVSVTMPAPPAPTLTAPQVTATAVSSTVAQLSWNAVSGAQGYSIYQVVNGQNVLLGNVSSSTTSVDVTGLTPGATESFVVAAFNSTSVADSAVVSVTMPSPAQTNVTAPQVTATAASPTSVNLSWNAEPQATGFNIYWSNGYQTEFLGTVSGSTTSVTVTGLRAGSSTYFLVEAFNNVSYADSQWVLVTTPLFTAGSSGFGAFAQQHSPDGGTGGGVAFSVVSYEWSGWVRERF
jgi:subtilase family serine protease